jgi:hypothetical protein
MASGAWVVPNKSILNLVNATNLLNQSTYKITLHTSAWTPNNATNEVFADATNELSTGNGYTAGGITLASVTLTESSGTTKFDSADPVWTASGGSIPAWRHAVIRAVGTINGKVDPIIAYFLGDTTPADIPATTDTNTLTIQMHANGIITIARAA